MKTTHSPFRQRAGAVAVAAIMFAFAPGILAADATNAAPEEPNEYRNWLQLGVGGAAVSDDKASFQRRHSLPRGVFGGVEDFHFEQDVGKRGLFSIDGRGIADNHDYDVRLNYSEPEKGYVRGGYREFRTWYDGSGGYFPRNGQWFSLYNEDFELDRGEAWIEGGLTLPDWPEFRVKYSHQFRDGRKDSTSWGDTVRTGGVGQRNIVPTFLDIDEARDIFEVDATHRMGRTEFGVGGRAEFSDNDNSRNIRRRPGELTGGTAGSAMDRYVTQKDRVDTDLFSGHAYTDTRFTDKIWLTTGYSFTTLDTDIAGSRIYGADYDPVYDPTFARRQQRDEGFLNLGGGSQLKQHVVNLNLMLKPSDYFTVVPSIRVENQDQDGSSDFIETDVGGAPGRISTQTALHNTRDRGFTDVSEGLEVRYTGVTNWAFYARGEWLQGEGDLKERETEAQTGLVARDTDSERFTQKYTAGVNWYPHRRANVGGQYYFKSRENDYDHELDSTPNGTASGDRYPAFLREQNFDTHDVNFRVTLRPHSSVTFVTRYDYQRSTIDTRADLLRETESADSTAQIFSESISWTPLARLFLQGSVNYVIDRTKTPASDIVPSVLNARNNYWNLSTLAGIVLTEKTDFQAQYSYYRADNYANNSAFGMPYGAGAQEHGVTGTIIHRLSKRMQLTLRYGFFTNDDQTSGGHNDYAAHVFSSSLRFVF